MRKISVLLALVICVTIGGVYAAWTYAGLQTASVDAQMSHTMETATSTTAEGELQVVRNTLNLIVDQTAPNDYHPKMILSGEIDLLFKPNPGASTTTIYDESIDVQVSFYTVDADQNLFDGKEIYVSTGETITIAGVGTEKFNWTKQGDGSFIVTIAAEDIQNLFTFGGDFVIDTYELYQQFHSLEEKVVLKLKFDEINHGE